MNIEALYTLSYGMYIICSGDNDTGNGFISNTVFQITSSPAKLAISCNKSNFTAQLIMKTGFLSVSVLKYDTSMELIGQFGYKSGITEDKLRGKNIRFGNSDVPIVLNDCISFFECKLLETYDVGSHYLFITEIIDAQTIENNQEPLSYAYYRNVKKGVAPPNAPTYIDKSKILNPMKTIFKCAVCGYEYDEKPAFNDLPDDWVCPVCGAGKEEFEEE